MPRYPTALMDVAIDHDPATLAAVVGTFPGAALLESGAGFGSLGRYSILTAWPRETFEATGPRWSLRHGANLVGAGSGNVFEALGHFLKDRNLGDPTVDPDPALPPFLGGAIGTFGYDLAPQIERLPRKATPDSEWPDILLQIYDWAIIIDHRTNEARLWAFQPPGPSDRPLSTIVEQCQRRLSRPCRDIERSRVTEPLTSNFTPHAYRQAVAEALEYIKAGDIFQVNLSQRFTCRGQFDALDLYLRLKATSPAPFAAFIKRGDAAVISASPELYYETRGSRILTRPIKGTRTRGATPEEDARLIHELVNSEKDRAELTMIVDLERNDLGRVCDYGSVRVTDPMTVESYAQVHHMVATVEGNLHPKSTPVDVLRAMFPGGSITGAPKIRAMEIIDELEPTRRGMYTGSVGYLSQGGTSAFNIAIRTMLLEGDRLSYQVGGGIVADSDPRSEYEETLHKGRGLRKVVEES